MDECSWAPVETDLPSCTIEGCEEPQYDEGVCFPHYILREYWGYELDGYQLYLDEGQEKGREEFLKWVSKLNHIQIVQLFSRYDYKVEEGVREAINEQIDKFAFGEKFAVFLSVICGIIALYLISIGWFSMGITLGAVAFGACFSWIVPSIWGEFQEIKQRREVEK